LKSKIHDKEDGTVASDSSMSTEDKLVATHDDEELGAMGSSDDLPCTTLQRNEDRAQLDA
jgi:hypothetical protein